MNVFHARLGRKKRKFARNWFGYVFDIKRIARSSGSGLINDLNIISLYHYRKLSPLPVPDLSYPYFIRYELCFILLLYALCLRVRPALRLRHV